jgi:putative MATE family efflux protein
MKKENKQYILSEQPVTSALIALAVPSILTSLVTTIHNMIDTYFISQLKDNTMIAATTVALPITVLIYALGEGLGAGAESCIGRQMGAGQNEKVKESVSTTLILACFLSVIAVIFTITGLRPVIRTFTDDFTVVEHAYQYLSILTMGSVFVIFKQVCTHLLRSSGEVQFPMKTVFLEVAINSILNPIFMFDFGLGMKVRGVAVATVIAQGISAAILLTRLLTQKSVLSIDWKKLRLNFESTKEITAVGSAVFFRNGLPSLSYGLFAKSAGLFGTDYIAASGLARKAEQAATFVVFGIAQGYQPFASYNYGARNKQRLMSAMKQTILFTVLYGCAVGLIFYGAPHLLMRIFTSDAALIADGTKILKWYAVGMPVIGIYQIFAASFQSMGKSRVSFVTSVLKQGIIYSPLVVILPRLLNETGFAMVQPACDWLSAIITCVLAKQLIQEIKEM